MNMTRHKGYMLTWKKRPGEDKATKKAGSEEINPAGTLTLDPWPLKL
jgi:hypothetical protein